MNLTHPIWEDDPEFDICNHIHRVWLDPPGTERQLSELSGRVFTELMDRNKPLWDLTVVDGLEGGRSALIIRIHHSLADGVSGVGLVNIIFDAARTPCPVETTPYAPPPLPDPGAILAEGLASTWADAAARLVGAQVTVLRVLEAFTGDSAGSNLRSLRAVMPELFRPAQKLPFNGPCSGERGHCWTTFPFGEARAIRAALGGTINDVMLTAVAGAISRYVTAHREPLEGRFARLLVPVNRRSGQGDCEPGNEISILPVSLPLDIADPVERARSVAMRSAAMKAARIPDVVALIGMWLGWTPPSMQLKLAALPFLPQPVLLFNMVCTNVPGPMIPLYSNGHELLTYYPHVPCGSDVGIGVAISSYNQNLYCGVTYDHQAAPDGELFRDFMIESYEELRAAAGLAPPRYATPVTETAAETAAQVEQMAAAAAGAEAEPGPVPVAEPDLAPIESSAVLAAARVAAAPAARPVKRPKARKARQTKAGKTEAGPA